jgi:hypothetical protein
LDDFGPLPSWLGGQWVQSVNAPDTLSFDYPATEQFAMDLKRPQIVKLLNATGQTLQKFWIQSPLPQVRRNDDSVMVSVSAHSWLGRLQDEMVESYRPGDSILTQTMTASTGQCYAYEPELFEVGDTIVVDSERMTVTGFGLTDGELLVTRGVDDTAAAPHEAGVTVDLLLTIKEHATAILGLSETGVNVRTIMGELDVTPVLYRADNRSILDCLDDLFKLSGQIGQYTILHNGSFYWKDSLSDAEIDIELGYNLRSLSRTVNDQNLATRLYVFGASGAGNRRVRLSDLAGVSVDYVEANTGTYGVVSKTIILEDVTDPKTLKLYADALLPLTSEPELSYDIDAIDVSAIGLGAAPKLYIGARANIRDTDLQIDATEIVTGISRRLDNEVEVSYSFARNPIDIESLIRSLANRVKKQETRDIGAIVRTQIADGGSLAPRVNAASDATHRDGDLRTTDDGLQYSKDGIWEDTGGGTAGGYYVRYTGE